LNPRIKKISIKNFKGIADLQLTLLGKVATPVITLIGLNESGKTTILEAISYFFSGDEFVSSIFEGIHSKLAISELVPINRKAAFNDSIWINAVISLDEEDISAINEVSAREKIDQESISKEFAVNIKFSFVDSVPTTSERLWGLQFSTKTKGGKTKKHFGSSKKPTEPNLWVKVVRAIAERIPRIAYFPTFLVDTPLRIYLQEHEEERPVNRYYRSVLQDILDSIGGGISLEQHVCKRIRDFKAAQSEAAWISLLFGAPSKAQIDSVFQKLSNAVTKEVLGSWSKVFQRPVSAKSISVEWNVDTQKDDLPYATFYVSDGESKYAVSQRSLGFRWFFSFLLFTAFKRASARPTLFLFDEPAANLHARAQAELLKSFSKITGDSGNQIIYSTHSHHMINPRWLSGAYIVENTALDYDSDESFDLTSKPTNILCTPYRQFVSTYPNRSSYFQPVIEQLEYIAPEIIGASPFLIVEGISDYYALRLVQQLSGTLQKISIMPGCGAGASGPLLSWLLGRGERFLLLLDDDTAGRSAAKRYRGEWHLSEELVLTLGEMNSSLKGKKLESLLSDETKAAMKAATKAEIGKAATMTKKEIGLFLAEACSVGKSDFLSAATKDRLNSILMFAIRKFAV
jgi:AAA15 family ATPase/GTPase